jgi:nephrocystin-3
MNWIPSKLAPNIRCVFSMIDGTPQHLALSQREPQPCAITLNPLNEENRKVSDAFTFWF